MVISLRINQAAQICDADSGRASNFDHAEVACFCIPVQARPAAARNFAGCGDVQHHRPGGAIKVPDRVKYVFLHVSYLRHDTDYEGTLESSVPREKLA